LKCCNVYNENYLKTIELTETKAKQLNELLTFAESLNKEFDIGYYQKNQRKDLDTNQLMHLLSFAKFYMKKYNRKWFYSGVKSIAPNVNTKSFLESDGFLKILKNEIQEEKLRDLSEKQISKNLWQLKYWWLLILFNAIIAFLVAKYSK